MQFKARSILKSLAPPILTEGYRSLKRQFKMHRSAIGGLWDEVGSLQYNFLVQNGLKAHHKFLDIGCGSLRGGIHFIKHLDDGNYYGMDKEDWLLDRARKKELPRLGINEKKVHLKARDDFDFTVFGAQFDYAIAQSVFTHLPFNSILRCLINVEKVLKEDGRFYATFFEDKDGSRQISTITHSPGNITTYPDRDPYHYEFRVFAVLAEMASLKVERIGEWNHPRNQMIMLFTKP